jgi:predicted DNA-binding protein (MmcQ/YjbR family)
MAKLRRSAKTIAARTDAKPSRRATALRKLIESMPGSTFTTYTLGKNAVPIARLHKVMGKMFAIQSLRGEEYVILKCDPTLAAALRRQYKGVGHRSHLDRRFWIAVNLNDDVPMPELRRMVDHSWALVSASLTRRQRAELGLEERGKAAR